MTQVHRRPDCVLCGGPLASLGIFQRHGEEPRVYGLCQRHRDSFVTPGEIEKALADVDAYAAAYYAMQKAGRKE